MLLSAGTGEVVGTGGKDFNALISGGTQAMAGGPP
jgi:hypothetical protein